MLVLTGASGFVGSQLVPLLSHSQSAPLLLVSRDPVALRARHPGIDCCDYAELRDRDLSGAAVIHLAVRNNDRAGTAGDHEAVNIDHLLETARNARAAGAHTFVNLCTTHALHPRHGDLYGETKAVGAARLADEWPEGAVNVFLPAVYGSRFQGRLAVLGKVPRTLRPWALALLRQLKPVVSIETLAADFESRASGRRGSAGLQAGVGDSVYLADPVPERGLYAFAKRAVDLSAVFAICVLLGWLMVLVAIAIRLDSAGPAIFAQTRVGRHGKPFTCYKFRTMKTGTRQAATHEVGGHSVTRVGAFLRRSKLDELPQISNIARNEMSLVGPRPCLPVQRELIEARRMRGVLELKPGVTGLAQINDIDMSDPDELARWDARYTAFRTILLDITILLRTVLGKGSGDRTAPAAMPGDPEHAP